MDEKVIIESKPFISKISLIIINIVIVLIALIIVWIPSKSEISLRTAEYNNHFHLLDCYGGSELYYESGKPPICSYSNYANAKDYAMDCYWEESGIKYTCIVASTMLFTILIYAWLHSYSMVVTDKRIYGKIAFGKRVDLPVDSISATSTISLLRGISVSTSSRRISFILIKNASEIYNEINKLIIQRQPKKPKTKNSTPTSTTTMENIDEIKKFKELLDMGIITQEEFDAKKKQLLGL